MVDIDMFHGSHPVHFGKIEPNQGLLWWSFLLIWWRCRHWQWTIFRKLWSVWLIDIRCDQWDPVDMLCGSPLGRSWQRALKYFPNGTSSRFHRHEVRRKFEWWKSSFEDRGWAQVLQMADANCGVLRHYVRSRAVPEFSPMYCPRWISFCTVDEVHFRVMFYLVGRFLHGELEKSDHSNTAHLGTYARDIFRDPYHMLWCFSSRSRSCRPR